MFLFLMYLHTGVFVFRVLFFSYFLWRQSSFNPDKKKNKSLIVCIFFFYHYEFRRILKCF